MTVSPSVTLRQLAEAATPGPWALGTSWRTIQGQTMQAVEGSDGKELGHSWFLTRDARLIALAPALAVWAADAADALEPWSEGHHVWCDTQPDFGEGPCNCFHGQARALFGTGLRKSEARNLRREHIDLDRLRLIVRFGKGGKDRVVAMTPSALQAVAHLDLTEGLRPQDYLWHTYPGGGTRVSRRFAMGDTTYSRWYQLRLDEANVRYLRPHTTRHTYHELLRLAGLSLEERQALMGHASIRTTADIYGHLDFDAVADKLSTFRIESV